MILRDRPNHFFLIHFFNAFTGLFPILHNIQINIP